MLKILILFILSFITFIYGIIASLSLLEYTKSSLIIFFIYFNSIPILLLDIYVSKIEKEYGKFIFR
jgi:hypothetical protein